MNGVVLRLRLKRTHADEGVLVNASVFDFTILPILNLIDLYNY